MQHDLNTYNSGYDARCEGEHEYENPHEGGTPAYEAWLAGWEAAEQDIKGFSLDWRHLRNGNKTTKR